jgi:hypothetical protein
MFPFDLIPLDTAPSALRFLILPPFEGIALGLVIGAAVMLVINGLERLFAPTTDAPAIGTPNTGTRPTEPRQPARPPALAPRGAQQQPRRGAQTWTPRTAPARPALLARLS